MKKIIPIHSTASSHFFCADTETWTVQRGYDRLVTNYLKAGVEISLLGIGETQSLLDTGVMDSTDCIFPQVALDAIVLRITKGDAVNIYVHEAAPEVTAMLTGDKDGSYRRLRLDYSTNLKFYSDDFKSVDTLTLHAVGNLNVETGTVSVSGAAQADERFADKIEIVGYSLNAYRTNNNRIPA